MCFVLAKRGCFGFPAERQLLFLKQKKPLLLGDGEVCLFFASVLHPGREGEVNAGALHILVNKKTLFL